MPNRLTAPAGVTKLRLLEILLLLLIAGCAGPAPYESPPSTVATASLRFVGLADSSPLDSIHIVDPAECRPLKRVEPRPSESSPIFPASRFVAGQSIAILIRYGGRLPSSGAPFECTYGFRFVPEEGKEYQVRAQPPDQVSWKLTWFEAKTGRVANRPPDELNCVANFLVRVSPGSDWANADRERICVETR